MNYEEELLRIKEWMESYKIRVFKLIEDGFILIERGDELVSRKRIDESYKRAKFFTYKVTNNGAIVQKWVKERVMSDKIHGMILKSLTEKELATSQYGVPTRIKPTQSEIKYCKILASMLKMYDFNDIEWLKPTIKESTLEEI